MLRGQTRSNERRNIIRLEPKPREAPSTCMGIRFSYRHVVLAVIGCVLLLYVLAVMTFQHPSGSFVFSSIPEYQMENHNGQWRFGQIEEIPETVLQKRDTIKIEKGFFTIDAAKNSHVYARVARPLAPAASDCGVLFLHGMKFSSKNWVEIESLVYVAAMGYTAVAIDLPGFGKTAQSADSPQLLDDVIRAFSLRRPILVSPSMSGRYSVPFVVSDPDAKKISGYVPIAPVGTGAYTNAQFHNVRTPTMILMGEKDTDLGRTATTDLRNMFNAEPFLIMDAGHACYLEKPDVFHRFLYNFIHNLEKGRAI